MEGPYGNPMTQTIEFQRVGDGTHLAITSRFETTEERDNTVKYAQSPARSGAGPSSTPCSNASRPPDPARDRYDREEICHEGHEDSRATHRPRRRGSRRREIRDEGTSSSELKADARREADKADGEARPARKDRRDARIGSGHGRAYPCRHHRERARPRTEDLVRDARVRAKDGKLICFFKSADKFKSRYASFGFEENAHLDDGNMWATSWALTKLTAADEAKIGALVKKAVS